jgi:uncharacterized protein YqeY
MLIDTIKEKRIQAIKNKNNNAKFAFDGVLVKYSTAEKSGNYELPLTDEMTMGFITKEIKEIKETQLYCPACTQKWLDCQEKLKVLEEFLPAQLTEDEVVEFIKAAAAVESNKGKIIGMVAKQVGDRFDKKLIKPLVEKLLS